MCGGCCPDRDRPFFCPQAAEIARISGEKKRRNRVQDHGHERQKHGCLQRLTPPARQAWTLPVAARNQVLG